MNFNDITIDLIYLHLTFYAISLSRYYNSHVIKYCLLDFLMQSDNFLGFNSRNTSAMLIKFEKINDERPLMKLMLRESLHMHLVPMCQAVNQKFDLILMFSELHILIS